MKVFSYEPVSRKGNNASFKVVLLEHTYLAFPVRYQASVRRAIVVEKPVAEPGPVVKLCANTPSVLPGGMLK